jgi:SRSO17 transposase
VTERKPLQTSFFSSENMAVAVETIWTATFEQVCQRIGHLFVRKATKHRVQSYLRGLLSPAERKNGWQIAEEIGEPTPYGVQYLLDRAKWDEDAVRDELRAYMCEALADPQAILILDETGFLKKGTKSVGVQRQYSGTAGRIENCQIGVFLAYASPKGHALIDRELYLPKSWTQNPERSQAAHVPAVTAFATKPTLALHMLQRTWDAAILAAWVTGDTVYGSNPPLRAALETRRQAYALAVSCQEQVDVAGKRVRVDDLAQEQWQRHSAGNGAKGPRLYDWMRIELSSSDVEGWQRWLVIRQSLSSGAKPPDRTFFLVFAPTGTPLSEMIYALGGRWRIEQCFEVGKGEVGLDDYEVRSWQGWYRHTTLCLLAQAFLTVLRIQSEGNEVDQHEEKENGVEDETLISKQAQDQQRPSQATSDLPVMIPLTLPEVRRLFYSLVEVAHFSSLYHLSWSCWRRMHQATAQLYHYKRRLASFPYLQL